MSYEINVYATQADFDDRKPHLIESGFRRKRDALREGKRYLTEHSYEVVKVQSDDREFIQVLTRASDEDCLTKNGTRDY